MKRITLIYLLASISLLFFSSTTTAQSNIKYGENYVVIEAEDTDTPLGRNWIVRKPGDPEYLKYLFYPGKSPSPTNDAYLECLRGRRPNSELEYKFTCPKTGTYQVAMRMSSPLRESNNPSKGHFITIPTGETLFWELADLRNDFFVKMEGDYTSGATKLSETDLRTFNKFFGRGANKWGTCVNLEHNGNNGLFYNLKKGEEYSFFLKGRSATTIVDYIAFYEKSYIQHNINNQGKDMALLLPEEIRPYNTPASISLDSNTNTLRKGTSSKMLVEVPLLNDNPLVTWTSSDNTIISVDENGNITGGGLVGQKAIITATSTIDNSLTAQKEIEIITFHAVDLASIAISNNSKITIVEGSGTSLTANTLPTTADDKTITWSSDDETIATVNSEGEVTTIKEGTALIRATSNVNSTIFDEIEIEVVNLISQSISFDDTNKYKNGDNYNTGFMEVTVDYEAGSLETMREIRFQLRQVERNRRTKIVNVKATTEVEGKSSGRLIVNIPLSSFKATANLNRNPTAPARESQHQLLVTNLNTEGVEITKGVFNMVIQDRTSLSVDIPLFNDKNKIFPNPANDKLFVNLKSKVSDLKVSIFNMKGSLVYMKQIEGNNNQLNISNIPSGVYLIQLSNKSGFFATEKLIIE